MFKFVFVLQAVPRVQYYLPQVQESLEFWHLPSGATWMNTVAGHHVDKLLFTSTSKGNISIEGPGPVTNCQVQFSVVELSLEI